jgi:glycosyltransferase involved in cell wall biosynthesis
MRVLIEALGIHYAGGGRSATLNLLNELFRQDKETSYTVLLSQYEPELDAHGGTVRQVIAPVRNRFAVRVWAQTVVPILARSVDLVHFAKNLVVVGVPTKSVVTVYDMTTLLHPEFFPRVDVLYWRWVQPWMLRRVDRVVAISATTAADLETYYRLGDKVVTIYPAYGAQFAPVDQAEVSRIRQKYGLPNQTIIHVGRIDRKKNLSVLVKAFAVLMKECAFEGKLVLVGEEYAKSRDPGLVETIGELGLDQEVVFTGAVPDEDLPGLYGSALLAAFPYVHEGFGIVAAEAMACGTPVIASRAGALVEAVGEAALLLDSPYDVGELARRMCQVWGDPELRQKLRAAGLRRARQFTPQAVAQQTLALYHEIAR